MKITDVKCAIIGNNPVVRIKTDEGIDGYAEAESPKPYLKPHVLYYKDMVLGTDPTDVTRVVQRIKNLAGSKPWGSAVSIIETALWDIAGKAAGLPIHKLLGGKVRDRARIYDGAVRFGMQGLSPKDHAEEIAKIMEAKEGFTIIKQAIAFHVGMPARVPDSFYGDVNPAGHYTTRGLLSEHGINQLVDCVAAMKEVTGDKVGLALDCGPGWTVPDAIRFAKAVEPLNVMWCEDMLTGDYITYVSPDVYREVTESTSTPIHTGEQIYDRQNFRQLIESHAVRIIGPDPADVGGIAELKWIAEFADMHGILMAPHGVANGLLGLAAQVQMCATLPQNYIAFEYPIGQPDWWYDIVEGLPDPIAKDGFVDVWDAPGLGVTLNPAATRPHLRDEDKDFFE